MIRISSLILAFLMSIVVLVSCNQEGGTPGSPTITGADTSKIPEIPDDPDVTGEVEKGPVPDVPLGEKTVLISSAELLDKIRSGSLKETDDYAVTDGESLIFESSKDKNKIYDLGNAVIRIGVRSGEIGFDLKSARNVTLQNARISVYGGIAVGISGARDCTLTGLSITGSGEAAISAGGRNTRVDKCTVRPDGNGAIDTAIVAVGEDIAVTNCNIEGVKQGIVDRSENGVVVENNLLIDCKVGATTEVPNSVIWYNTIRGGEIGVAACFEKSELSACMSQGYNIIAAMNIIENATISVCFENVSNGVVLLNDIDCAKVTGGTNMYVNENIVSGTLTLGNNNYLLANKNTYGKLEANGNTNVNGDNLTDIEARSTVGVNEDILPHINKEQFAGMVRKQKVRSVSASDQISEFIPKELQMQDFVIIPPGAYSNPVFTMTDVKDVKIYAYGVLSELGFSQWESMYNFSDCERVELKGMFLSTAMYTHTQGTVTSSQGKLSVSFVADPGYRQNFADGNYFGATAPGFYFKGDNMYPETDFSYQAGSKSYSMVTNTNTIKNISNDGIKVGDRVAFRTGFGGGAVYMSHCSEMLIEDVTTFSCSGFAEYDTDNDIAPTLHRFAVVAGPAPILDNSKSYEGFEDILWTDSYGRLRSAEPMNTSCDATHSSNERVGLQVISCLFERMNDDAGNIGASYGLASSYIAATKTLTYTKGNVNGYEPLPGTFREGDDILIFTWSGKLLYSGKVKTATADIGNDKYTVQLSTDITLPTDGEKVVVQNASASGRGFLIDNVLVRDAGCNGFRIKARGGMVKNTTFDRVSKGGINCIAEYQLWPECGFVTDIKILNNVFNQTGNTSKGTKPETDSTWCAPICIRFSLNDVNSDYTTDADYLLHTNIEISGNVFSNRFCPWAISAGCVNGLKITDNTFGAREGYTDATDTQSPILLFGGNDILIDSNIYAQGITDPVGYRRPGSTSNVSGSDVK